MTAMTFGQLVESQMKEPSVELQEAAEYVIDFGKHSGMNLSMLMEMHYSYCMWVLNQEESKNAKFNTTVKHLKVLLADEKGIAQKGNAASLLMNKKPAVMVDGVELVEGEKAVLFIDPANPEKNGVYEATTDKKLGVGFISGLVSKLLEETETNDMTFDFNSTDTDIWFKLVKEMKEGNCDVFVMIETKDTEFHPQRIKRVF